MKKSAGIIIYRQKNKILEVFLVHPGGPFWKNKDIGVWSLPKGEFTNEENALDAAKREVEEETGIICDGAFIELTPLKQKSGKMVYAWAHEKDIETDRITSNTFQIEWPPRSGKFITIPEVDRGEWFQPDEAKQKIIAGQTGFIDELILKLKSL